MRTMTSHAGERVIDHRNSPGAYGVAAGQIVTLATKKCCGCQRRVVLDPNRTRGRHYCRSCNSFMCDDCYLTTVVSGVHTPFNKVFEQAYEAAIRGLQVVGVQRIGRNMT
jgi:hypothetical protein